MALLRYRAEEKRNIDTASAEALRQAKLEASLAKRAASSSLDDVAADLASFQTSTTIALGGKEPSISAGTTAQFWRGDKTWQTLSISAVSGLSSALSGLSDAAALKVAKAGDTMTGPLVMPSYLKASLPSAATYARSMIYVSDLTGGAEFCFSDGSNWRRLSDRSVAS